MKKDYRKELERLNKREDRLIYEITEKLLELSQSHPDAIITQRFDDGVKAKCLTRNYLDTISVLEKITFIERIEEWCSTELVKV